MRFPKRIEEERVFVESTLGDSVICETCGATLNTYAGDCIVDLDDECPGYMAIEKARARFSGKTAPQTSGKVSTRRGR